MGRWLGIDYGTVRLGIALSDETAWLATPLFALLNNGDLWAKLLDLKKDNPSLQGVVIGLPLHMSGHDSPMTQQVRLFAQKVEETLSLPVVLWDERLSTAQVEKNLRESTLRRKQRAKLVDAMSAALILQTYLDASS
jgi:putative Holliday junction resolvase